MKNTIKLLFLGLFLLGITATRAQISTSTGGAANVLPNAPTTNTNVGIGTTNPTEKLEIVGNIKASGTATFASTVTAPTLNISGQTTSTIASFDAAKNIVSLPTVTYPSLSELSFVKGATSSLQQQITSISTNVSGNYFNFATSPFSGYVPYNTTGVKFGATPIYYNGTNIGMGVTTGFFGIVQLASANSPYISGSSYSSAFTNQSPQLALTTTNNAGINIGGSLMFGGKHSAAGAMGNFGRISGRKENANDNNNDGYLNFETANDSGKTLLERMRITSLGHVLIGTGGVSDGINNLQVAGYTRASGFRIPNGLGTQFLKADGTTSNVGADLSLTSTANSLIINNSTGAGVTVPLASATVAGLIGNMAQTIAGIKTFSDTPLFNTGFTSFYDASNAVTFTVGVDAGRFRVINELSEAVFKVRKGEIEVRNIGNFGAFIQNDLLTANRVFDFPDVTGTIALTSDLTAKQNILSGTGFVKSTAGVISYDSNAYAPLASPALTNIPTAPTAAAGTNTTQLATTAFVLANAAPITHNQAWSTLTSTPTTLAGYGITDTFKNLRFVPSLNTISESGIYREEQPSSGYSYTTTLNMNSADGRQQLTIDRNGSGMKFRGSITGGTANDFGAWKTVIHDGNVGNYTIQNQNTSAQTANMWISGNGTFGGNVGIGTTTPNAKLEVNGDTKINGVLNVIGNNALTFSTYGGGLYMSDTSWIRTYGNKNFYHNTGVMRTDGVFHVGPNGDRLVVDANGKVGIGTATPDERLAVNGNIHSKEVRVDLTGWPDYVFTKAYDLPTLKEVEKHIIEKGHLQNIPSAKEVALKGVLLGDMNAKLLQKVEELTLYAIEQQKELDRLKTENENYKSLSERLSAIEKELKK